MDPPEETATVVVTGIDRSTVLWEMARDAADAAVARHDAIVETALVAHSVVRSGRSSGSSATD